MIDIWNWIASHAVLILIITVVACSACTGALALHFRSVERELRWALRTSENCRAAVEKLGQAMSEQSLRLDYVEALAAAGGRGGDRLDAQTVARIRQEILSIGAEAADDIPDDGETDSARELDELLAQTERE